MAPRGAGGLKAPIQRGTTKGEATTSTGPNAKFVLFGSNVTVEPGKLSGTIPATSLGSAKGTIGGALEYPIVPGLNFKAGIGLGASVGLSIGGGSYELKHTSTERESDAEEGSETTPLLARTVTDEADKLSVTDVGLTGTAAVEFEAFVGGSAGVPYIGNPDAKLFAKAGVSVTLAGTVSGSLERKKSSYDKFSGDVTVSLAGSAEMKASVGASTGYTVAFISGDLKVWTFKEWPLGKKEFKYAKSVTVGRAGNKAQEVADEGLQHLKTDLGDVGKKLQDEATGTTITQAAGLDKSAFERLPSDVQSALEGNAIFSTDYATAKKAWVKLGGVGSAFPSRSDFVRNAKQGYGILL